jgi:hypothetical protein
MTKDELKKQLVVPDINPGRYSLSGESKLDAIIVEGTREIWY